MTDGRGMGTIRLGGPVRVVQALSVPDILAQVHSNFCQTHLTCGHFAYESSTICLDTMSNHRKIQSQQHY